MYSRKYRKKDKESIYFSAIPLEIDSVNVAVAKPKTLEEFIGQKAIIQRLRVMLESAKKRGKALDHILLSGPPGLGKTTLAGVIASEMQVKIHSVHAPLLTKPGDVAKILSLLEERDILFIDEIHRLPRSCEEMLYTAMEDYYLDIILGEGVSARSLRLKLPEFTLIGATTRAGYLSNPLYSRFGIEFKLEFYKHEEIKTIIMQYAASIGLKITEEIAEFLAPFCRMTPREAIRIVKRIYDYVVVENITELEEGFLREILKKLGIYEYGIHEFDKKLLQILYYRYNGGPVGMKTLSSLLHEEEKTLLEHNEPYLLKMGFIEKTPKGRVITPRGIAILQNEEMAKEIF